MKTQHIVLSAEDRQSLTALVDRGKKISSRYQAGNGPFSVG